MDVAMDVLLWLALIPLVLYIVNYRDVFRATWQGWGFMAQKVAWSLLVIYYLTEDLDYPGEGIVLLVIVGLLVVLFWTNLALMIVAKNSPRPVSRKRGAGIIPDSELERETPRRVRRRRRSGSQ